MRASRYALSLFLVLGTSVACGSSDDDDEAPADVSGSYTVNITNRENDCQLDNWNEGASTTDIKLDVTQDGSDVNGTVGGVAAVALALVTGNAEFSGTAEGNAFFMTSYGTISHVEGNCSFTWNVTISGSLDGDAISGSVSYVPATNDNPDCAAVECENIQEFSGARPPK